MCNNEPIKIPEIRQQAINMADELLEGQNLQTITNQDFRAILNPVFDFVNANIQRLFINEDHSDSGPNAQRERDICREVARHISNRNLHLSRDITFDEVNFAFNISRN